MTSVADVSASIDSFLDEHRGALLDLVTELVRVDSQIPPFAHERHTVQVLGGERSILAAAPHGPNLITRVTGMGVGRSLILNGNLDTKPVGDAAPLWNS